MKFQSTHQFVLGCKWIFVQEDLSLILTSTTTVTTQITLPYANQFKYPMIAILVPLVLFYPFSFQRNHIKPFIFSRTQWSNRLVIMIRFQLEVLVHKSDNFIIQSIANCGGSNRSPPYQVQYQIPTEPTHNGSFVLCFCMICNLQIK